MKQVALFLLLFGAGVLVLWKLEQRQVAENEELVGAHEFDEDAFDAPDEDASSGVHLSGRFEVSLYAPTPDPESDEQRLALRVASQESASRAAEDVLSGVEVRIFDPKIPGSIERGKLHALEARLPRGASSATLKPTYTGRVHLETVTGKLGDVFAGTELDIETDAAVVDSSDPEHVTLDGTAPFHVISPVFEAGSTGVHLDVVQPLAQASAGVREDVIELVKDGWISFEHEARVRDQDLSANGRLRAVGGGPLQIRRRGVTEPHPIFFEVWEGGQLDIDIEGEEGSALNGEHVLTGQHILLEGVALQTLVRPRRLDLDGDVLWKTAVNEFRGESISIEFTKQGSTERALIEGLPSARLEVGTNPSDAGGEDDGPVVLDVKSAQAIELRQGDSGLEFLVAGEAIVETEGVTLRSNGDLSGSRASDASSATFRGTGGVDLDTGNGTLEAAEFELRMHLDEDGELLVRGTATGGARVESSLPDGRHYVVTSPNSLEVERVGDSLRIVEGLGVELTVQQPGEGGGRTELFFARCDHLTSLALDEQALEASGNVLYKSGERQAECDRLEVRGGEDVRMWGSPDVKASLSSELGRAQAREIVLRDGRLHARGDVTAELSTMQGAGHDLAETFDGYDLGCDVLDVYRELFEQPDGTVLRRFDLEASGNVVSKMTTGENSLTLQRADSMRGVRVDHLASIDPGALGLGSTTEVTATGDVEAHATIVDDTDSETDTLEALELTVFCDTFEVSRTVAEEDATEPELALLARGNVRFEGRREFDFRGNGELLRIDPDRTAHLEAPETGSVRLLGDLPPHGMPFRLVATRVDFALDRESDRIIEAVNPEIRVMHHVVDETGTEREFAYRARAERLTATVRSLELTRNVRMNGLTDAGVPWTLDSARVTLEVTPREAQRRAALSKISATGNVTLRLGSGLVARADGLFGVSPTGVLRMTGNPATIESPAMRQSADWMVFDPELQVILEAGPGDIEALPERVPAQEGSGGQSGQEPQPWKLEYNWLTTRVDGDSLLFCMQEPNLDYVKLDSSMRASWSIIWIDRDGWLNLSDAESRGQSLASRQKKLDAPQGPMRAFFDFLDRRGVSGLVQEAYFEGPVEVFSKGELVSRADAVYFDLSSGHGWLANATVNIIGRLVGQDFQKMIIKADWLRHSANGALRAKEATLTTCDFDDPHVRIVTGDLRLVPLSDDLAGGFEVSLSDNRIEMYSLPDIPLPPLGFDTDEDLEPRLPSLRFGNTARFGQLLGLKFSRPARKLGRWFDGVVGVLFGTSDKDKKKKKKEEKAAEAPTAGEEGQAAPERKRKAYDARYDIGADYLGSRGFLFDLGFKIKERGNRYWFDFISGVAVDDGRDRGYIRVDEDLRDSTRLWLRSQGGLNLGKHQLRMAYSDMNDPGVQSEFYEKEFVEYERDESYALWRRSSRHTFSQVSVKVRADEFIADVEELPEVTLFSGRAPVGHLGSVPLVHTGDFTAAYLRRRRPSNFDLDGDGTTDAPLISPFRGDGMFPDPFDPVGSQEVVRADLTQELEAPLQLGSFGRLVPFVEARGTAWNDAADQEDATRFLASAGARLSALFWKPASGGGYHQFSPYISLSGEVASEVDGTPFVFDETEQIVFGDIAEVGARSRFGVHEGRSRFDVDLRGIYARDRLDGAEDGWLPLAVFARAGVAPGGRIFDIWYDARYDSEENEWVYSMFSLGTRFGERAGLQIGHTFGRDDNLVKLFDAATVSGFYRWTEKWEFEGRQTVSLLGDERLGTSIILRRYGHDLIFDIEADNRTGEGSSINFSVKPRLAYRPSRIGYTNW